MAAVVSTASLGAKCFISDLSMRRCSAEVGREEGGGENSTVSWRTVDREPRGLGTVLRLHQRVTEPHASY